MLRIKYKYVYEVTDYDAEGNETIREVVINKSLPYTEANMEIARAEAYNGEISEPYDDGVELKTSPTTEERFEALEAAVAMLCMPDVNEV